MGRSWGPEGRVSPEPLRVGRRASQDRPANGRDTDFFLKSSPDQTDTVKAAGVPGRFVPEDSEVVAHEPIGVQNQGG
jgi:hypothetical protein